MISTKTVAELIQEFELYTDDTTELATAEEIIVLNKVLRKIGKERDWYFLIKTVTATLVNNQVALPTDFENFVYNGTDDKVYNIANKAVVYVGDVPFEIIGYNLKDDPNYQGSYAYTDGINLYVPKAPTTTVTYAYKATMGQVAVTTDTLPIPKGHEEVLLYGMLVDDSMIIKLDALKSQIPLYQVMQQEAMSDLRLLNSKYYNY